MESGIFEDTVAMMVFVTMADIDDRWTRDMSLEEERRYYREIIRRLQKRLPKEEKEDV